MVSGTSLELSQLRDTRWTSKLCATLIEAFVLDYDIYCIQQGYSVEFRGSGALRIAFVAVELRFGGAARRGKLQ